VSTVPVEDIVRRLAVPLLCLAAAAVVAATCTPLSSRAAEGELTPPAGKVVLIVSGHIARTNGNGVASFDREMLERLGLLTVRTSTVWTDGVKDFEGPLVRDVLAAVGVDRATEVTASALNDYAVVIPAADFDKYGVILALRMDGRELLAKDKGPAWIVYPRDDNPELRDARYDNRWVWQLNRLQVQ
jgi:hypothetical protein